MGSARLGTLVITGLMLGGCFAMNWDYSEGAGGAGGDPTTSSSSTNGTTTSTTSTASTSSGGGGTGTTTGSTTGSTTSSSTSSTGQGGAPSDPTVYCDGVECNPGKVCCFSANGGNGSCEDPGSCGGTEIQVSCNDPGDCPGEICCATMGGTFWAGIQCQPTCNGADELVMCEGDPSVCPPGEDCMPDPFLGNGYSVCY